MLLFFLPAVEKCEIRSHLRDLYMVDNADSAKKR